ncbi:hypothetical protein [Actinomadura sp. CNU-125]|uniref:hypothetical protein n=1 Tax=Actinomadura sp. CNU-125 TaxID=1904961 RepID=UPI00117761E3|nr:hypothetical protein [Actinomadura sp. CNU-125]
MSEQMVVYLGNRDAVEVHRDEAGREVRTVLPEGRRCTTVVPPTGLKLGEVLTAITAPGGVWNWHSDGDPAWVASTNPLMAELLADHYGCEIRDPEPQEG